MKVFRRRPAILPLVVPCRVLAFPLSYTSTVTGRTYIPLIVISISLFFLVVVFLAIKLVYMKYRRIGTIHASPTDSNLSSSSVSGFGLRDKQGTRHRGLLVGCLGSPTWETNLTSKLHGATWRREQRRRSSFVSRSQLHTSSTIRSNSKNLSSSSRLTKSTALTSCSGDVDQPVLLSSSGLSRIPAPHGGSSSKALCSVQRHTSTDYHPCYGDFGESHGARLPGGGAPKVARRASPSSIRLVDGPSHSNQVEYSVPLWTTAQRSRGISAYGRKRLLSAIEVLFEV
ncbi:hypothetical protein J3R83DRAFT_12326 [Lanmaoa asiatica]|nr:hypothetical protein J3R83DRAFT_12326 [Lanmaoa asiatica]